MSTVTNVIVSMYLAIGVGIIIVTSNDIFHTKPKSFADFLGQLIGMLLIVSCLFLGCLCLFELL